jgi:hypothetical protein
MTTQVSSRSAFHTARGVWGLTAIVTLTVAPYLAFVLGAYYVNDLDRFPIESIGSGLYDPKGMWPTTVPYLGGWAHGIGLFSIGFVPVIGVFVLCAAAYLAVSVLRRNPRARGVAAGYAMVAVACLVGVTWFVGSDTSEYLAAWQAD